MNKELEDFIKIFNLYLELIVNQLRPNCNIQITSPDWVNPKQIYSFNYTNTYQSFYDNISVEYLHGSCGEYQNIVLGIADLEHEELKQLKAYGFTKYHQKLFKDTDYLFLDEFKNKILAHTKRLESFEKEYDERYKKEIRPGVELEGVLNLNIIIWGHSLDLSDKEYILDLFSLNDEMDRNVRVIVYYFDRAAKFSLLNRVC